MCVYVEQLDYMIIFCYISSSLCCQLHGFCHINFQVNVSSNSSESRLNMAEVTNRMQKKTPRTLTPVFNSVSSEANPVPDHENVPRVPSVMKELLLPLRLTLRRNITFDR